MEPLRFLASCTAIGAKLTETIYFTQTRKSQNRDSQREFRKRRQEYVAELEEKIKLQGESMQIQGERIEILEQEIARLRTMVDPALLAYGGASGRRDSENGGGMIGQIGNGRRWSGESDGAPAAKRLRSAPLREAARQTNATITAVLSTAFSELEQPPSPKKPTPRTDGRVASCGHCTPNTSCFCSEVGFSVDYSQTLSADLDPPPFTVAPSSPIDFSSTALPLRSKKTVAKGSIWAIEPIPSTLAPILCSGDPENCSACRDDPYALILGSVEQR